MRRVQRVCRWDDEGSWEVLTAQDKRAIHLPYTMKAFTLAERANGRCPVSHPTHLPEFLEKKNWLEEARFLLPASEAQQ